MSSAEELRERVQRVYDDCRLKDDLPRECTIQYVELDHQLRNLNATQALIQREAIKSNGRCALSTWYKVEDRVRKMVAGKNGSSLPALFDKQKNNLIVVNTSLNMITGNLGVYADKYVEVLKSVYSEIMASIHGRKEMAGLERQLLADIERLQGKVGTWAGPKTDEFFNLELGRELKRRDMRKVKGALNMHEDNFKMAYTGRSVVSHQMELVDLVVQSSTRVNNKVEKTVYYVDVFCDAYRLGEPLRVLGVSMEKQLSVLGELTGQIYSQWEQGVTKIQALLSMTPATDFLQVYGQALDKYSASMAKENAARDQQQGKMIDDILGPA